MSNTLFKIQMYQQGPNLAKKGVDPDEGLHQLATLCPRNAWSLTLAMYHQITQR